MIRSVTAYLAQRRGFLSNHLYKASWRYILAYENCSNKFNKNGERFLIELHRDALSKVILDVGANVGQWARVAASTVAGSTIHAFEPIPGTFGELNRRLAAAGLAGRVRTYNFGLSETDAQLNLALDGNDTSTATVVQDATHTFSVLLRDRDMVPCTLRRGDAVCAEAGIEHVDFLKVDAEGHEIQVLRGLSQMLNAKKIQCIQLEHNEYAALHRVYLYDIFDILEGRYNLYLLLRDGFQKIVYHPREEHYRFRTLVATANGSPFETVVERHLK